MTLIPTVCVCGRAGGLPLGRKDERTVGVCPACGVIRTLDRAPNYATFYESDAYHASEAEARAGQRSYYERADHDYQIGRSRLAKLQRFAVGGDRLLDVGTANGGFLRAAREAGYDAFGLEPNPQMARFAQDYSGCPVEVRRPSLAAWPGFDIVTYHDVFEHVVDPIEELAWIATILRPGGLVVLDVPTAEDERFVALGMEWHHMKPQEHLWFWTTRTLTDLLLDCEWHVFDVDYPIPGKLVVYGAPCPGECGTEDEKEAWQR